MNAANLSGGNFTGASFRQTELNSARLAGGIFARADFAGAEMRRTDIRGVDLSSARGLTQSQIARACGDGSTRLPRGMTVTSCGGRMAPPTPPRPPAPPAPRNLVRVDRD